MKSFLVLVNLLMGISGFSQITITDQPGPDWYNSVWAKHQQCMLTQEKLLNVKRDFNVESFQDTLRAYDWIDLGGYRYVDKATTSSYNEKNTSYDITRLDEGDTLMSFGYDATYAQMDQGSITHTNFKETIQMQPVWKVKKINGKWFVHIVNYDEYLHLISFQNGILIYDIPWNGKTTDTRMFARNILMAFPKGFAWSKTTN
jgi:hypothetical protein